jgi:hypothetical protein
MRDLLGQGEAMITRVAREHLAQAVTYRRGNQTWTCPATEGRSLLAISDPEAVGLVMRMQDWLIAAEDLPITPQPGDRVETANAAWEVFEIPGEPCWRWTDGTHSQRRIHVKEAAP